MYFVASNHLIIPKNREHIKMIRTVQALLYYHLANGSPIESATTPDQRPIINWIKTFDLLSFGARGSQFLGEYGGTFNLLETYGCNCHAVISGKTGSGRPVDELDKESVSLEFRADLLIALWQFI